MSVATDRVVVMPSDTACGGVQVHHREFPEIRAEGADAKEAATHLGEQLTRALDSALTKWRREAIESAISEVKTFGSAT